MSRIRCVAVEVLRIIDEKLHVTVDVRISDANDNDNDIFRNVAHNFFLFLFFLSFVFLLCACVCLPISIENHASMTLKYVEMC